MGWGGGGAREFCQAPLAISGRLEDRDASFRLRMEPGEERNLTAKASVFLGELIIVVRR